jgi:hypothetical protein
MSGGRWALFLLHSLLTVTQDEEWSLWSDFEQINSTYKAIKIPHGREETPKSLNDRKKWKGKENWVANVFSFTNPKIAAENRYFALLISVPLLGRYFTGEKKKYLLHWVCFVEAIRILSMDKITNSDLNRARILLDIFVVQVAGLYGPEFSNLEIHLLTHLHDQGKSHTSH